MTTLLTGRLVYATTLVALSAGLLFGQAGSGTIVGTVSDQGGSTIPEASVTVVNQGTQFTRVLTTGSSGQYDAEAFPTGQITITVEHPGFEKLVRSGVVLTAADTLTINLLLTVGNIQQTVEVKDEAPLLQSQTAAVTTLITNQQILDTPLNGRMFTQLIQLSSGASPTTPGMTLGSLTGFSSRVNAAVSINGATAQNNSYLVDGIYDVGLWINNVILVPTVDSIQEERIMGADYSAQYGAAAGAITVVQSKQGTNGFHGSAYEFLRNNALDANTFFNNKNGIHKLPFRRNEYGGTIDGPSPNDQTVFFVDYSRRHVAQPTTTTN